MDTPNLPTSGNDLSLVPEELRDRVREIENLRLSLEEMLEDPDADLDGSIEDQTLRFIAASDEETALAAVAYYKDVLEPAIVACKHAQERLRKRRGELEARCDWTKSVVKRQLAKLGVRRVQDATHFASLRAGSLHVRQVGEVDLDLLPDELVKREVKPRLDEIGRRLKADEHIEGFEIARGEETVVMK